MKVGDYVRTKYGIGKIDEDRDFIGTHELHLDSNKGRIHNVTDNTYWITNEDIIKSSPNIIDLVEVGDVITIEEIDGDLVKYEVEEFQQRDIYGEKTHQIVLDVLYRERYKSLPEIEPIIKSIVTKQQFESMEYRIGE